jgi:hypothetical protein
MKEIVVQCDVCGERFHHTQKPAAVGLTGPGDTLSANLLVGTVETGFITCRLNEGMAGAPPDQVIEADVCSRACAVKLVERSAARIVALLHNTSLHQVFARMSVSFHTAQ